MNEEHLEELRNYLTGYLSGEQLLYWKRAGQPIDDVSLDILRSGSFEANLNYDLEIALLKQILDRSDSLSRTGCFSPDKISSIAELVLSSQPESAAQFIRRVDIQNGEQLRSLIELFGENKIGRVSYYQGAIPGGFRLYLPKEELDNLAGRHGLRSVLEE